ncbi:hypothetical protein CPC08DRAFT_768075 [Agrocybe pediades]|nr:hypothetical protein CPC08DRAFT_768075 [Agrocybe pediades]
MFPTTTQSYNRPFENIILHGFESQVEHPESRVQSRNEYPACDLFNEPEFILIDGADKFEDYRFFQGIPTVEATTPEPNNTNAEEAASEDRFTVGLLCIACIINLSICGALTMFNNLHVMLVKSRFITYMTSLFRSELLNDPDDFTFITRRLVKPDSHSSSTSYSAQYSPEPKKRRSRTERLERELEMQEIIRVIWTSDSE